MNPFGATHQIEHMKIVQFRSRKLDEEEYWGEVKVQGYTATEYGTSPEDVQDTLIKHLLEEDEIKVGEYTVETPTE